MGFEYFSLMPYSFQIYKKKIIYTMHKRFSTSTQRLFLYVVLGLSILSLFACVQEKPSLENSLQDFDADGDGYQSPEDCNDQEASINPFAKDICGDGIDQDCNGTDLDCQKADQDKDSFSPADGDCNDEAFAINPNAQEICDDGIDQNCDGVDQLCNALDLDQDGYSQAQGDCDDTNPLVAPKYLDTCEDGIDQNCDGSDLSCDEIDRDGDSYSIAQGDCNDQNISISPIAMDRCGDGIDQNCDGIDQDCAESDRDGDGIIDRLDLCPNLATMAETDRDDDGYGDSCDNCINLSNADQSDRNGNGIGDACEIQMDEDQDGFSVAQGDCNDQNSEVSPRQMELCDGIDQNCNQYVDEFCPNDLRSTVVEFSAGPSLLGSTQADVNTCRSNPDSSENCDEVPQQTVRLNAFAIESTEVTQRQYQACIDANRCTPPLRVANIESSQRFGQAQYANHPMTWINQIQAESYCQWLGARLPTEAEWERAARANQPLVDRQYLQGNQLPSCNGNQAQWDANLSNCAGDLLAVKSIARDQTGGVFDLIGNAHEIVAGWYTPDYYGNINTDRPEALNQQGERDQVPIRGGSYREAPVFSTITYRGFRLLMGRRTALGHVGFRCAYDR
jgi:formylglycine-generating enzyme required for sulfatase activity